jgi:hypothetical protein
MVLEIKHRDDVPFGELLLSKSEIYIESKKWKTPLNYIFSKLFSKGMLHEELRNASVDDLATILTNTFGPSQQIPKTLLICVLVQCQWPGG